MKTRILQLCSLVVILGLVVATGITMPAYSWKFKETAY